ncbi:Pvc16 family protein [Streptomyces sp. NPDC007861]|uniref:Pvc16 family protein n=1 Tax=Streptomyces sp. NPDC007861 TaxID=3154893 RepID=UPI00340D8B03
MINHVDAALEAVIKQLNPDLFAPKGSMEIIFKPPTKETVQIGDSRQLIDVYLYDVQEAAGRRQSGSVVVRSDAAQQNPATGRMDKKPVSRHAPPRYLKLSYMLTVWTAEPKDSHRILGLLFAHLAKVPVLALPNFPWPHDTDPTQTVYPTMHAELDVGRPAVQDRILTELWTTFNNTLVPFLNVTVTAPVPAFTPEQIAHVVEKVVSPLGRLSAGVEIPPPYAQEGEKR